MTRDIRKYDYIDALRGYAILGVLLVHSSQYVAPSNDALALLMSNGMHGVQLFYIASALTLCMSWELRSAEEASPIRNFFLRRFFRIAPMFYLGILFYVLVYGLSSRYWAPNGVEWWFIPLTALFMHGFHPETITSVVPGGWSIAVEMNFYLILPFLLTRLNSAGSRVLFLGFSIICYVIMEITAAQLLSGYYPEKHQYLVSMFTYLNFFAQLPVFAIGILTYWALRKKECRKVSAPWGILFCLLSVCSWLALQTFVPAAFLPSQISFGIASAILALTLAYFPVRSLVNRVTTQIGTISYSMYLTHFAVLYFLSELGITAFFPDGNISSVLHFLCVVLITAAVSQILYKCVERPGTSLGKCLISRLEQRSAPGAPQVSPS